MPRAVAPEFAALWMPRFAAFLLTIAAAFSSSLVEAQAPAGALIVKDAWMRKPPGVDSAAVYFTLQNTGARPVTVINVTSAIATHVMIHETATVDGMSRMRMKDKIVVAPGQTMKFAPEGLHVMVTGFKYDVVVGDTVTLSLKIDGGGTVNVPAVVRPLDATK